MSKIVFLRSRFVEVSIVVATTVMLPFDRVLVLSVFGARSIRAEFFRRPRRPASEPVQ